MAAVVLGVWLCAAAPAWADSARVTVRQGNELYRGEKYPDAIKRYDEALVDQPGAIEPKFNKANSCYKLDDLPAAIDLYQQVAAETKDMQMVARAKYNLGDCFFQRGSKQRDSDLQKAVDDMKSSISCWRQVLDIDPKNEKAARNIEAARLTIKDILDEIKKKKEQQKQDPNQPQNQQQQQDPNQAQQQKQSGQQNDPNQPQDPNQAQKAEQKQDPNQAKQGGQKEDPNQAKQQKQEQQEQKQQEQEQKQDQGQAEQQEKAVEARDAEAQEILDKEQRQKDQRQILQRAQIQKVEKDW
jgi:Ca-activated chloride channel family protein